MSGSGAGRHAARLVAEYGADWSDRAADAALAADLVTHGQVDGLAVARCALADDGRVLGEAHLSRPLAHLQELNARVYALLGLVAEDLALIERSVGADRVEYAFIIGSESHGHRGSLTVSGANLPAILRAYDRLLLAQGAETLRLGARHQQPYSPHARDAGTSG